VRPSQDSQAFIELSNNPKVGDVIPSKPRSSWSVRRLRSTSSASISRSSLAVRGRCAPHFEHSVAALVLRAPHSSHRALRRPCGWALKET
jgi:hypothetical protein